MKKNKNTAVVIGSGNVARQLALQLQKNGIKILQVYSRTKKNGISLSKELKAKYVSSLKVLEKSADFCLIAVSDDAIPEIGKKLRLKNTLVFHTSGTVTLDAIKKCSVNTGVLYPLQTIQKDSKISFSEIPLFIEASNKTATSALNKLAGSISKKVVYADSEKRKTIHLAAVFANNFSNHLFSIADELLKKEKLDIKILLPLIKQTVENLAKSSPSKTQTGPAKRGDKKTIRNHMKMLKDKKTEKAIYKILTKAIQQDS